jgi:histidyl-tRNA synthetase
LGFAQFTIRINHRLVLNGLLERIGVREKSSLVLRALDKLGKTSAEAVQQEMITVAGLATAQADEILRFASLRGSNDQILTDARLRVAGNETGEAGLERLAQIVRSVTAAGVAADRVQLDVSTARGLDYYTGVVFETFLNDLPDIGSVCSGGRYDNLAELYTKQELPGVGASLGLDRLLAAMEELGMLEKVRTPADVFVAYFDETRLDDYLRLAAQLREAGIGVELYPECKKLGQQLKYAASRGFPVALIAGGNEFAAGTCKLKDLRRKEERELPVHQGLGPLVAAIRELLALPHDTAGR